MDYKKPLTVLFIIIIILLAMASCEGGQSTAYPTRASVALPATFTPIPTQTLLASDSYGLPPESITDTPTPQLTASESSTVLVEALTPTVVATLAATPDLPALASPTPAELARPAVVNSDDSSIVYVSNYGNGTLELRLIDLDGEQPYTLANITRDTRLLDVTPDGRFAVISNDYAGTFLIELTNGSQQIPLATTQTVAAHFSLAGDKLLYIEKFERAPVPVDITDINSMPAEPEYEQISGKMFLVDIASGQQKEVEIKFANQGTLEFNRIEGASWSPDGDWFIFQVKGNDVDGRFIEGLFRYSLATREVNLLYLDRTSAKRILYPEANKFPVLSPDGSTILTNVGGEYGLYTIPIDGGEPRLIFNSVVPLMESPQWSPDGKQIAVLYDRDIFLLNSDGSEFYNLTQTPYHIERHLSWSPDGQQLLYTAETRWGGQDIWRYDIAHHQAYRITRENPAYTPTDNYYPFWASAVTELAASPVPVVEPDLIYKLITSPPVSPPENIDMAPPQSTINPPWWGERYLYRRKITISGDEPIQVSTTVAERPVLAQVSFATDLILDRLRYGADGHDIQLAWWGGDKLGWVPVPCSVEGLDEAVTVITFSLQETIADSTDRYYLYYGSVADIMRWESHSDLGGFSLSSLGISDLEQGSVDWQDVQTLLPDNISREQENVFNWQNFNGRPVLILNPEQSVAVSSGYYLGEGTIVMSFYPNDLNRSGTILGVNLEMLPEEYSPFEELEPIETYVPVLFYDGVQFHFRIDDQDITFVIQNDVNHWHHFAVTWRVGDFIRVYVDGEMIAEAPDEPSLTLLNPNSYNLFLPWFGDMVIGRSPENVGLSGQYMNLVTIDMALTAEDVRSLYQAAWKTNVSIAEQFELPVVVAEIPPEGGQVMVPNGDAWIEFLPDTFSQPTTVSIIGTNIGSTKDENLARFIVLPGDVRAAMTGNVDPEEKILEMMEDVEGQKLSKPFMVYYRYELGYVAYPGMINLYRFDRDRGWLPLDVFVSESDKTAVAIGMEYWGDMIWTQSEGLLVPPPVVNR